MTKWKGEAASYAPGLIASVSSISNLLKIPAALALALGMSALPAMSADRYWDANGTSVGTGGTGTWNVSSFLWSPNADGVSGPYAAWSNPAIDTAIFGGTTGTVTIGVPVVAAGLTFNTANYILTGSPITLSGMAPIISTVGATTINASIQGTSGFVKKGAGDLTLGGVNTFTGNISLDAGTIVANTDAALGAAGNQINTAAASVGLTINGATATSRTINIGTGGTLTVSGTGVASALITGAGNVRVRANGNEAAATLSNNASTYDGTTTFYGCHGVCYNAFTSIADLGIASSLGAPTTAANGKIIFSQSTQYADILSYLGGTASSNRPWEINGAAAIIQHSGTGTLTLSGEITTTGETTFRAVNADFNISGVLTGTANYNFEGSVGRSVTLAGANQYNGTSAIRAITVQASVLGNSGSASSFGTGSSDILIANGGTLAYIGTGGSSNRGWTIGSGTTATASGAILNNGTGALALSGDVLLGGTNANNFTLGGSYSGTANTLSGVVSGTGNLVVTGGIWTLSGANSFTGTTTVSGGVLRAGSASVLGVNKGLTVNAGGTLELGGFDLTSTSLDGNGGTIALGANTLTVNSAAAGNYAGEITGSGGLTKRGAGSLTLTGQNSYTGATTVEGSKLVLDFSSSGGPTSDIINSSSALNLSAGTVEVTGAAGENNSQTFNGLIINAGSNNVRATSGTGGSITVNLGAIHRNGGVINFDLASSGSMTTTSADGIIGGWATVNGTDYAKVVGGVIQAIDESDYSEKDDAGTWLNGEFISDTGGLADTPFYGTVSNDTQLAGLRYTAAANSTVTIGAGNTLGVDGTIIVAPSTLTYNQTLTGGYLTGGAGGSTLGVKHNGTGTFTIGSTIIDNGGTTSLAKDGSGVLTLTGTNTYTGVTTLTSGILRFGVIGNGGVASNIGASSSDASNLVLEGGRLQYVGVSTTTDRGFTLVNGSPITIDIYATATNLEFSGLVTSVDNAGFTKAGPGTLTLSGASNNYVGTTTVIGGTLVASTLTNGGVASSIGAASSDPANIVLAGGSLAYSGSTTSTDRGVTLGAGGGGLGVTNALTTLTMSGEITGTVLRKEGEGTLVLSGANTYTGGTTVKQGLLGAGAQNVFGTGSMTVDAGAGVDLNNFNNRVAGLYGSGNVSLGTATLNITGSGNFSGTISGTGGITRTGGYTQVLSGCGNSYTGATAINSSSLSVNCLANGGVNSAIGASSSDASNLVLSAGSLSYTGDSVSTDRGFTLQPGNNTIAVTNAATTLEFSGNVVGAGGMNKTGLGTLILSGTNSSTGTTTISQSILRLGSASSLSTGQLVLGNDVTATLDMDGYDATVSSLRSSAVDVGSILLDGATLTISDGQNASFGARIQGSGNLVKNGSGNQNLTGCASDYTGVTTINAGALIVTCLTNGGTTSSIGSSSADASNLVLSGGTLQYAGTGGSTDRLFTLGASTTDRINSSGTGAIAFTNTGTPAFMSANTSQTLNLGGTNAGDNSLAAKLTDNGTGTTSLIKDGTGVWILKNSESTYTGVTTINGGVLGVDKLSNGGVASSIGASSSNAANLMIGNNSTLRYTGTGDTTDRKFTLLAGVTFIEASGTGAVVFSDTGPVALSGAANSTHTLALGGSNSAYNTFGGALGNYGTGVSSLAKNDAGTWVLTGNNTFTGNTNINGGNLIIGNGGTSGNLGTGNVSLNSASATLSFNRSDAVNFAATVSGSGTIAQIGSGTTVLSSVANSIAATRVEAGTLDVSGTLSTSTIAMNGSSTLRVAGTVNGDAGGVAALTGDAGSSIINIVAGGMLKAAGDLGGGDDTIIIDGTLDAGVGGSLSLSSGNDKVALSDTGNVIGTIDAGSGGESGSGDILEVNTVAGRTLNNTSFTNFETLNKLGTGTLTLTGAHGYSAGTVINAGTVQVGNGAVSGSLAGNVTNNATLAFNLDSNYIHSGLISGSGTVNKLGSGTTTLTGDNTFSGVTNVQAGTLLINGDQSGATGTTTVQSGAVLGGTGTIGGSVDVLGGATLSPGSAGNAPGTLTINGDLNLASTSNINVDFGQANVVGGPLNDLVVVNGDLSLDGQVNITETPGGTFGPGVYRIISYSGSLTDNGLTTTSSDYVVQTSVANQVNLINSAGLTLSYWDGDAGPHNNGIVNGGNGTWLASGGANWTDDTGTYSAAFANGSFAIFEGAAGTVTVDNGSGQVQASGMQFATNGYSITGGGILLTGTNATIRVGDGTLAGSGYTATIASTLSGTSRLVKTDLGTLVLSGANTYSGGTAINGGTVQIANDANLGIGDLTFNGGTLRNIASMTSVRGVNLLAGGGTFDTLTNLTLSGPIMGSGGLTKTGSGKLTLNGVFNVYQGDTVVNGGTLAVYTDNQFGMLTGSLTLNGGTLENLADFNSGRSLTLGASGGTFLANNQVLWSGNISGTGALTKSGSNMLILTANTTYTGGTTIEGGTLQLGYLGTTGSILGDVVNNGTLAFGRSDQMSFTGLISGTGGVTQQGTGTTVLTGNNSYSGQTLITGSSGALYIDGDQSLATGTVTANAGTTLGGKGTIGGSVILNDATLNPGDLTSTPGVLTINGNLSLTAGSNLNYNFGQAGIVGGAYNDLTVVHGNLTLAGTINTQETLGGDFGPGIYRVISYDGTLTDLGLASSDPYNSVQTSIANQVNLVRTSGLTLNFWDGAIPANHDNDVVDGGSGTWKFGGDPNWTTQDGDLNGIFSNDSFAIFAGTAGTVTVDNSDGAVGVTGMQFATGGYTITGDDLTLSGSDAIIRVGDGTLGGGAYTTTIAANLVGAASLTKTDLGTLVLSGTNSYSGGTNINQGTISVAADANLGASTGGVTLNGGTLQNSADMSSARSFSLLSDGGTFLTDGNLTLSGLISGAGDLNKTGTGNLVLNNANSYSGDTTVSGGTLFINGDQSAATGSTAVKTSATLGGNGIVGGNVTIADGATLAPGSTDGAAGTLTIRGNLGLSAGSTLNYNFGAANVAGGALNDLTVVEGNLVLDGTINVSTTAGGSFGPGIYRIFSYGGTLTDNGLSIGSTPGTTTYVQTAIANQVNLINTTGATLSFWDGAGNEDNNRVDGGNGTWTAAASNTNWTVSDGAYNGAYSDDSFAIFSGNSGTVTVDNTDGAINVTGMQFTTDGYVISAGSLNLTGSPTATIRVGDGTGASADMVATISSALTGNSQLVKTDLGTLVLSGTNSYSGGTAINAGTLSVSADENLGHAAGSVTLNGGTLQTTADFTTQRDLAVIGTGDLLTDAGSTLVWNGAFTGAGVLTKLGAGELDITSTNTGFLGTMSIQQGTVSVNGSLCGLVEVHSGGRLQGNGTVCDTVNDSGGTIAPGIGIGQLTVDGDYTGNGGLIEIETVLGGDNSSTDRLVITGNTSGSSNIQVINLAGAGAQTVEGIKIIDVGGVSNGTFTLVGDYLFEGEQAVIGGAYAYRLYKNGVSTPDDGDWYLRSVLREAPAPTPVYAPTMPLYEAYAGVLQSFNELGTLQQRVGTRSWSEGKSGKGARIGNGAADTGRGIWGRIDASHSDMKPKSSTTGAEYDTTVWKLQAGLDGLLSETDAGVLVGGITAHIGSVSANVSSLFGDGSINSTGYGFGGTLTWYGENGFYADAQAQLTWYDSNILSSRIGKTVVEGNSGFGYALSIEAGQKIEIQNGWSVTPQAQLAYSSVHFNGFTDEYGADVSLQDGDRLIGRVGLQANHERQWTDASGRQRRSSIYGIANLYYDFLGRSQIDVSGVSFDNDNQKLWGGVGLGGTFSWADGRYAIYGEAMAKTSLQSFGDSNMIGAKVGFTSRW